MDVEGQLGREGGAAPGKEGRNMDHLCLRIEPFDAAAIAAHLRTHGVAPGDVVSRYGAEGQGPSLYIADPEGNVVELKGPPAAGSAGKPAVDHGARHEKGVGASRHAERPSCTRKEFDARFRDRFFDPAFGVADGELEKIIDLAWDGYDGYRKNPRTRVGGKQFADPKASFRWSGWRPAAPSTKPNGAQRNRKSQSRVLLVNGSSRSDQSCPGEMSKTYRLAMLAQQMIERERLRGAIFSI